MSGSRNLVVPRSSTPPVSTLVSPPDFKSPRIKLPPGRSQLDWARLEKSGQNLRGVDGYGILRVTKDELSKHNKREDCWMAFRGRVYNVTAYLEFHPGGSEVLLEYAGKEATSAFLQMHPWVNIEHVLNSCFVGILVR